MSDAVEVVRAAETIILCPIVLGELLAGFGIGKRSEQNRKELEEFIADSRVMFLTLNAQTSENYSQVYRQLREKGTPIPTNDMWIAAFAKQLDAGVFTYDGHFAQVEGIQIIQKSTDLSV